MQRLLQVNVNVIQTSTLPVTCIYTCIELLLWCRVENDTFGLQRWRHSATLLSSAAQKHRGQRRQHWRRRPERTATGGTRAAGGPRRSHGRHGHIVRTARTVPPVQGKLTIINNNIFIKTARVEGAHLVLSRFVLYTLLSTTDSTLRTPPGKLKLYFGFPYTCYSMTLYPRLQTIYSKKNAYILYCLKINLDIMDCGSC